MDRRFFSFLLRHRLIVLAMVVAISIVAGIYVRQLHFVSSLEIWFIDDDPDLERYREFLDMFGADETIAFGVFADDVFDPDVLAAVDRITRASQEVEFVHRVRSLTNLDIVDTYDDVIEITRLMDELPQTGPEADRIRAKTMERPLLRGNIVSEDGGATAILVEMDHAANSFGAKSRVVDALKEIRDRESRGDITVRITGSPVFDQEFMEHTQRDFTLLGPAAVALVLLVVFIVFRRLSAALIPLSVVLLATLWTFGLMGYLGIEMNALSASLVSLILAVGVADSVHILADYYQRLMQGMTPEDAVSQTLSHLLVPCLFTSATTCAGMLSLQVSSLAPIRELGWLAAVGVFLAFLLSFTYIPVVLRLAKPPDPRFIERQAAGPMTRLLDWLGRPRLGVSRVILAVSILLVVASFASLSHLEVGANPMGYFRKDDPMRVETRQFDDALGGSTSIEFLVTARDEGFKEPEVLRRLDDFERWLEEIPGVHRALSAVDSLKEMNRVFQGGDMEHYRVPDSRPLAAQFYLLLEGEEDFESMLQPDYEVGRITERIDITAAEELAQKVPLLQEKLRQDFGDDSIEIEATGFVRLMNRMGVYLLQSQRRSFLVAFVVVSVMMTLLLRSLRLGALSLIPNLVPILLGLAFMAVAGIHLDPGTVMIGGIALGLVVDDTVHYLVAIQRQLRGGSSIEEAIARAMRQTGRPIIVTSVVLASGFSILLLGNFTPNIYFGLVSAVIILTALVADLVVLPAALLVVRPRIFECQASSREARSPASSSA